MIVLTVCMLVEQHHMFDDYLLKSYIYAYC